VTDLAPPSSTLVAGKYRLIREIGRGGMGAVWEAQHATLGTLVAVKFIDASYAESHEARTRFDNEARAAASLQSKHAIQIHDHGVEDGRPYIVMELLIGEALDKRLDRLGRLSLHETARILLQVCRGLGRAHERGITHRDLKPENIFLVRGEDDDGDDEQAKILDFGIAKMRSADGMTGLTSGTKTGAVLGTPYFMSPEQARGLKEIDHRSDLWSLGVIAYKCVIGVLPFEGQAIGDLLVKICTSPAPVPSQRNPELPPSFDAWFARTMEKEPERRFQSAGELAEGLAYAAGLSSRGRPSFDGRPVSSGAAQPYNPMLPGAGHTAPIVSSMPHPPLSYGASSGGGYSPNTPGPGAGVGPGFGAGLGSGPAPGGGPAVTSAPFTTSMYPSGLPRSRHGLAWGLAAVAALAVCVGVGTLMYNQRVAQDDAVVRHEASAAAGAPVSAIATPAAPAGASAAGASNPPPAGKASANDPSAADAGGLMELATSPKPGAHTPSPVAPGGHPGHGGYAPARQNPPSQQQVWVPVPVPVPVPAAQPAPAPRPYVPAPPQNQRPVTDQSGF
jgi:serine/threonine protein kinase